VILLLTGPETIAIVRDLAVIVFLALAFMSLSIGLLFSVLIYRRLARVMDAAETSLGRLDETTESLKESIGQVSSTMNVLKAGGNVARIFGWLKR
jgi:hypothetical protein